MVADWLIFPALTARPTDRNRSLAAWLVATATTTAPNHRLVKKCPNVLSPDSLCLSHFQSLMINCSMSASAMRDPESHQTQTDIPDQGPHWHTQANKLPFNLGTTTRTVQNR